LLIFVKPSNKQISNNFTPKQSSSKTTDITQTKNFKDSIYSVTIENIHEISKIKELELLNTNAPISPPENSRIKSMFLFNNDSALWEINAEIMKYISENNSNQNINQGFIRSERDFGGKQST
jgi:hypothetical protein